MKGTLRGVAELVNAISVEFPCVIHENWTRITVEAQKWNV